MDKYEFQGLIKKYSPLIISLIGIIILLILGETQKAYLLLFLGLAMQYFWIRKKYPRK